MIGKNKAEAEQKQQQQQQQQLTVRPQSLNNDDQEALVTVQTSLPPGAPSHRRP
jgi:quercetin dioxygenase-like cupin family protein